MTTKRIEGGREWTATKIYVDGWDSECGSFRIIPAKAGEAQLLICFDHEDGDGDFLVRRFRSVEQAMAAAEMM